MTDGDKNEEDQVVNAIADTRRRKWLIGYQPRCALCEQPRLLRHPCQACRRLVRALKVQAKRSILCGRIRSILLGTMPGKKTLTDAFRLNASDKPFWARWPPFNFEAFFANLDQQAQRAQQAAETTKIPNGYLVCSQCQQRKLRSHFSKTQLDKPTQKRRCTQCTKPATDDNISWSRCQQAQTASQIPRSQMDTPSSEECMQFLLSTTEATSAPYGCISYSHCQHVKLRTQFSHTPMQQPSLKRKCLQCATCEAEATRKSKSYISCSQCQQAKLRSHWQDEAASKRKCIEPHKGKMWASGVLAVSEP